MRLSFFGATRAVTGSNFLLEADCGKILVDCGLFQGNLELIKKNSEDFAYNPSEIDAVLLTHAHLDHCGRLPKLVKEGFCGPIFATPATIDLAKLILKDSLDLQEVVLFSSKDLEKTFSLFSPIEYHELKNILQKADNNKEKKESGISFKFLDAGHILGSAIIEVFAEGKKIIFSGDLGNSPTPLLRTTEFPSSADYVLIESTYADREHPDFLKRKDLLEDAIENTIKDKGVLMVPSFALERTQELLYELNELVENHRIPEIPIFVDSPLAIKSVNVYKKYIRYYNKEASFLLRSGDEVFNFPRLKFTMATQESKRINDVPPPKMIIAGSGMSTGGRILHHELRYLSSSKNCLLLVSFQVKGSIGREIQEGKKEIKIFGNPVSVNANIRTIEGYSAHSDKNQLSRWLFHIKNSALAKNKHTLKKVFVVHGEEGPAKSLCQIVKDKLGIEAKMPEYGHVEDL